MKSADAPADAPDFDEDARDGYWQQRQQKWLNEQAQREADWKRQREQRRQEYLDYLDSIEWRRKREAVLARDEYKCQAQLPCCIGRASQAHHLSYDRIFDEPLFDLVAVCRPCHEHLHAKRDDE